MTGPRILALGGAHIDRRGRIAKAFVPGASNPGAMREDVGGGAANAVRAAVQRGAAATLISVRGGDSAGDAVAERLALAGIAYSPAVYCDRATPSYTAILSAEGEVIAALADMDIYDIAFPREMRRAKLRHAVAEADAVLCDANLPATALEKLARLAAGKPLSAIAVSPAKVVRLAGILPALACLFLNRREAVALTNAEGDTPAPALAAKLAVLGLARGIISEGGAPALAFDASGMVEVVPPAPPSIVDATGAGDALAGVATVALLADKPIGEALREGIAAAWATLQSPLSVAALDDDVFEAALRLVPPPRAVQ